MAGLARRDLQYRARPGTRPWCRTQACAEPPEASSSCRSLRRRATRSGNAGQHGQRQRVGSCFAAWAAGRLRRICSKCRFTLGSISASSRRSRSQEGDRAPALNSAAAAQPSSPPRAQLDSITSRAKRGCSGYRAIFRAHSPEAPKRSSRSSARDDRGIRWRSIQPVKCSDARFPSPAA